MKKEFFLTAALFLTNLSMEAQPVGLANILTEIKSNNPALKMADAEIRSLDEVAKGSRNWMPPELGTGLWMVPYNPRFWKKDDMGTAGMGQYMISAQQMFPNRKRFDAEEQFLQSVSSSQKERKNASLNNLYAEAKKNYYEWIVIKKKLSILDQNERLLNFMIQSAEIRYKNGLGKISAYYKTKAALGNIQNMRLMLLSETSKRRITLNTLMNKDKLQDLDIDTNYSIKNISFFSFDSTSFISSRSDIRAIEKDIQINSLEQGVERAKLKPEFGLRYEHMFGFGGLPMQYTLMGMVKIPMAKWSSRASKANIESLKWKTESLNQQRAMLVNEAIGMAYELQNSIDLKNKQIKLFEENIIPALQRNYKSMQLAYEQNTEELFSLFDAWESLNMTQLEYLQQFQDLVLLQVELERILETNN